MCNRRKPEDLRPIDDLFFNLIYCDVKACQELLRVIFNDDNLEVINADTQYDIPNLKGRGVRLDAICKMSDGSIRNIEVQRSQNDDILRRIRYNASCITAQYTPKGSDFKDVRDVHVIFITEFDLFGKELMVYHLDTTVREKKENSIVDDGLYRMCINASAKGNGDRLSKLMKYFLKPDFEDPEFPEISKQVYYYKHTPEGAKVMSDRVREMLEDMMDIERAESLVSDIDNLTKNLPAENLKCDAKKACELMGRNYQEYLNAKALLAEESKLELV